MEPAMYNEKRIKKSELLQLILLDNLYAQTGSESIIFQGGTALRWVYGGMRFSEDLDFVTNLPKKDVENILARTFQKTKMACIAQFAQENRNISVSVDENKQSKSFIYIVLKINVKELP